MSYRGTNNSYSSAPNMMYNSGQYLEQQNNTLADQLSNKVSALKSLTIQIGDEVRDQNRLLSDMDTEFDSSGSLLGSTMRRLGIVSKAGGHKLMCYLILFALFVFMIIWYLAR
uniref:t-SNARE coiled-coil homology domain-containing protein n=1 Tax=Plectus sambesii TaxID=2011161 RepID=A0A914UJE5_9BILA